MLFEIRMVFEKSTKNTYRYQEVDEGGGLKVGYLYVQKSALGPNPPSAIRVVLENLQN